MFPNPDMEMAMTKTLGRRFFVELNLAVEITGLDINLNFRFKVTISSRHKIDTKEFAKSSTETAKLFLKRSYIHGTIDSNSSQNFNT